jgi:hypothetical protein
VRFKLKMVEIGEEKELQMAIKAAVFRDGTELYTVGFLGQEQYCFGQNKQDFDFKTSLLKSLSCMKKVAIKQRGLGATITSEWLHNLGVASFRLFDDIQQIQE